MGSGYLPAMSEMTCPFCKQAVVTFYDDDPEDEEVEADEDREDDDCCPPDISPCEHVAFWGVWGYEDFETAESWEVQVNSAIRALVKQDLLSDIDSGLEWALIDDSEQALSMMRDRLRKVDIEYEMDVRDTGDGPQGTGVARYMFLFMREKQAKKKSARKKTPA